MQAPVAKSQDPPAPLPRSASRPTVRAIHPSAPRLWPAPCRDVPERDCRESRARVESPCRLCRASRAHAAAR
jgi:hypothetical protein